MTRTVAAESTHQAPASGSTPVVMKPKVVTQKQLEDLEQAVDKAYNHDPKQLDRLDLNVQTPEGDTLVFRFLEEPEKLEQVLKRGAPVDVKTNLYGVGEITALIKALDLRLPAATCEILLLYGANVDCRLSSPTEYILYDTHRGMYNIHNFTPLFLAIIVDLEDPCSQIATLLDHGADMRAVVKSPDYPDGNTCLHVAATTGKWNCIEFLLEHGADINQLDGLGNSALVNAAQYGSDSEVFVRLFDYATKTGGPCTRWSDDIFCYLLLLQPIEVTTAYLDSFVEESEEVRDHLKHTCLSFRELHHIYGPPWKSIDDSALRSCVNNVERRAELKRVLTHPTFEYVIEAKWQAFGRAVWVTELAMFITMIITTSIAFLDDDPTKAAHCRNISVVLASVFLLLEAKDFVHSPCNYLFSVTNWLNLAAYIGILVVSAKTWSTPAAHTYTNAKAVMLVLLTFCGVEYLRIVRLTGLLIAMMTEMLADVAKFLALYMVFQVAFTSAFFEIFRDNPDSQMRFGTYSRAFVSTFFMLFGDFEAEMFLNSEGSSGVVARVLVILYLIGAMVILLNILIAMMSTSYQQVADSARSMQNIGRAELVLRNEALLPQCIRIAVYDSLIPDSQPWCKYAAHKASQEEQIAANAKKAMNGSEEVTVTVESVIPIEADHLAGKGDRKQLLHSKTGETAELGHRLSESDAKAMQDSNVVEVSADFCGKRFLGSVVLLTIAQITVKERVQDVSQMVESMQEKLERLSEEQQRFQHEVQTNLLAIGKLLDQLVNADKQQKQGSPQF